jgi:hypothetical protein
MRLIDLAVAIALGLVSAIGVSNAQTADDKAALQGLKEVKLVFDVTTADAKPLLIVLTVIEETRASLIKQGVTPTIVVTFRGPATKLVQSNQSQMKPGSGARCGCFTDQSSQHGIRYRAWNSVAWQFGLPAQSQRTSFRVSGGGQ